MAKRRPRKTRGESPATTSAPAPEPAPVPVEAAPEPPPVVQAPATPAAPPATAPTAPPRSDGLTGFYLHLHPRAVRRRTSELGATLGLGLGAAVSLGLATLSGLLLMIHYVPSVERAHSSVQDLLSVVPLGRFLRNLHRWSGHAAVLLAFLHLARTFLWGAYRGAHRRVWLLGVLLLFTTIATSYSGYLLPWDQDAYWTVTVGTSLVGYVPLVGDWLKEVLLGGAAVGQAALTRFYVLHVALLPALGLVLLALHLFRLRRAGGLARPPRATGPGEELVPASPTLVTREAALAALLTVLLCALALAVDARLGPAPDLLRPDDPPKAPWFLVGLQEAVAYSAAVGGLLFPGLLLLLLALLPWLDSDLTRGAPGRPALAATALVGGGAAALAVRWWGDPQAGQVSWWNPASIAGLAALAAALLAALIARRRALLAQGLVGGLLAALLVLTAVGWLWRGADWRLVWHPGPGHASAGTLKPAAATASWSGGEVPTQVRSAAGGLDRCPTCHRSALLDGGSKHPAIAGHRDLAAIGCSSCHGGQGRRLDGQAHQPGLGAGPDPFLRRPHLEARCARCHVPGLEAAPALAQGIREYLDAGCTGCHQPGRLDQGLGPDLRRLGRRTEAELLDSILDPEGKHAASVMWSMRWRFDDKSAEGKRALGALLTALLAFGESARPFQPSWPRPELRSDVPCGGCHLSPLAAASGKPHRCTFLRETPGLRCRSCHEGGAPAPARGEGGRQGRPEPECPQLAAARPTCQVCHGGREGNGR